MNDSIDDADEWRRLYEGIRAICLAHGKEEATGEGDFWVVDDCWGGVGQKIVITNPSFLTQNLVADLSACITRLGLLGAEIVVALEPEGDGPSKSSSGLVVHSGGFEEYWDILALRRKYGSQFFT